MPKTSQAAGAELSVATASSTISARQIWARRLVAALLTICCLLTFAYAGITTYMATLIVKQQPLALAGTPAQYGLAYRNVEFPARIDHLAIRGWFIPGVLQDGQLTDSRVLIMVHGAYQNRTDPAAGLLSLSSAMAEKGFAVLVFDMRGTGQSAPAPFSLGYFEQRDVLGAVDFLRSGPLPYPDLGRPRVIGGWGVSMGAISLLLAAAQAPAIQAIVADSAYPDIAPILERQIPLQGGLPDFFTPGALAMDRMLYGIDFYNAKPGDVVARFAPRPILFIQGAADTYNPPYNLGILVGDAEAAPNANVQSWLVPGAKHAQAYHVMGLVYVDRLVSFYTAMLGPDSRA
ncbi:MAG: alpha/beta hydrolase [Ktedonobacterales bacterium]